MKIIYKVLYPIGYEPYEVTDSFPVAVPYTAVPPLDISDAQYFDFAKRKWVSAQTQDVKAQLDLLENLHAGLKESNEELKEAILAVSDAVFGGVE